MPFAALLHEWLWPLNSNKARPMNLNDKKGTHDNFSYSLLASSNKSCANERERAMHGMLIYGSFTKIHLLYIVNDGYKSSINYIVYQRCCLQTFPLLINMLSAFCTFWLIGLKSQWACLIINHKLCTICLWTHSDGAHGGRYSLPLPTPTHPYPYPPLPPATPTTNNGLERSQFINNVKHGLERSQFINNVKHGLERSQWSQMIGNV